MGIEFLIDSEKTDAFSNFLKNKSRELDCLYKDVLQLCDRIEDNYKSEDSSIFLGRFRKNINTFVKENEDLYEGGNVIDKTNALYNQQEDKWAKEVTQLDIDDEVIQ